MNHLSNTKAFADAAAGSVDSLVKAYCGLVAIELTLKQAIDLRDHDVPSGLRRLNSLLPKPGGHHLLALASSLGDQIELIRVTGKKKERRAAPRDSYPYIRYTTFDTDGWAPPCSTQQDLKNLAALVMRIRVSLKTHYRYKL